MPSAYEYTPTDRELWQEAQKELDARQKAHTKHWEYYQGYHPTYLKKNGNYDDNVVLNIIRQSLDRTLSFLIPEFPYIKLPEQGSADLENFVWQVWKDNGGATMLYNMALNGGLDGHVFARVQYDEKQVIRIYNLDASQVLVFWHGDNQDVVLWYSLYWQAGRTQYRQDIINRETYWDIIDYKRVGSGWQVDTALVWDYPLPPIVDWQHWPDPIHYYGESELQGKIKVQNSINKTASDISRILRFHASPRTIATGVEAKVIQDTGIDEFYAIPAADAKVFNLEMQSDLQSSMAFLQLLITDYQNQARVIMTSGDPAAFRGMTNLGIRATFLPMLNKNEVLRRNYGYAIMNINRVILMLSGQDFEQPQTLLWANPLPEDENEKVMMVKEEMALGLMSAKTASSELGLDYDQEQDNIADEQLQSDALINGASVGVSQ